MENYLIIVIIAYVLLGLHSAYFFVRRYTLNYGFEIGVFEIVQIVIAFFLPIISHLATCFTYVVRKDVK